MEYTYLQAGPTYDATMDIHMRVAQRCLSRFHSE